MSFQNALDLNLGPPQQGAEKTGGLQKLSNWVADSEGGFFFTAV